MERIRQRFITSSSVLLAFIVHLLPVQIRAEITDAQWVGMGQIQGIYTPPSKWWGVTEPSGLWIDADGYVYVQAIASRVAGMNFKTDFVKWDGVSWCEWNATDYNFGVDNLFFNTNGALYGALRCDTGYVVASWDGDRWCRLAGRFDGAIRNLIVTSSGSVYVSGDFTSIGNVSVGHVVCWDGSKWNGLNFGIRNGRINAMTADTSGNLYVAGSFDSIGQMAVANIAKWDGNAWSTLEGGVNDTVSSICFDNKGNLYAGGKFDSAGEISASCIAMWDGAKWYALTNNIDGGVDAVVADGNGNLFIGGKFNNVDGKVINNVARLNNGEWSSLGTGVNNQINNMKIGKEGTLFVFGQFTSAGGKVADQIAGWDGGEWFPLGQKDGKGLNLPVYALAVDNNGVVYAGGDFTQAGLENIRHIAKYANGQWSDVGGGISGRVNGLTVDKNGSLYVWGAFDTAGSTPVKDVAKWDGTSWTAFGHGFNSLVYEFKTDFKGNIYACGDFVSFDSTPMSHIAKWDGTQWSAPGNGLKGVVTTMAVDKNSNLYVAETFYQEDTSIGYKIVKWDGMEWRDIGSSLQYPVSHIAVDECDNIYISVNSLQDEKVFKLDGNSWIQAGEHFNGPVFTLAIDNNGMLYAGGEFDSIGSSAIGHIAMWDGTKWRGAGSGTDAYSVMYKTHGGVHSLVFNNSILYAGGAFTTIAGKASPNFAYCNLDAPVKIRKPSIKNTPSSQFTWDAGRECLQVYLKSKMPVGIGVYSLTGQLVHRFSENFPAGDSEFQMSKIGLAKGSYVAQVKAGNESMCWKMIIDR